MIKITSYLKDKSNFHLIENFEGDIPNIDYIEGSIELEINGILILNRSTWDYIDCLWSYIVEGIVAISNGEDYSLNFPDQPISIAFNKIPRNLVKITVTSKNKKAGVVKCDIFLKEMIAAARFFFEMMRLKAPENAWAYNSTLMDINKIYSQ